MPAARNGSKLGRASLINRLGKIRGWIAPGAFLGVLFLWPVARLLSLGISTSWYGSLFNARVGGIVWFTIWQALISTVLCVTLALPGAYVLHLRRCLGQSGIRALITVPFIMPSIVVAVSFTSLKNLPVLGDALFGHSPVLAIICAQVFMNYGLVVRAIGSVWAGLDPASENAAALDGAGRLRTFVSVTLPQLSSVITSSAVLVFLYCTTSFGLVLVLGGGLVQSIETEMYSQALQHLELGITTGLAIAQTLITLLVFWVFYRIGRPMLNLTEGGHAPERKHLDRRDLPAIVLTAAVVCILILTPMISVISKAFMNGTEWSLSNFANLASFGARDVLSITLGRASLNSLRNLTLATAIAMLVGVRVSHLLTRPTTSHRTRQLFDTIFQLPVGISTVVLGLGYLVTFSDGIFPLRSSWLVFPLVQSLIAIPLVIRLVYPAMLAIDRDVLQGAETEGATVEQIWWFIQAPMIRGAIRTAVGYVALISLGEFGAASFLVNGSQGTLPTVLYQLVSRPGTQNYGMAMATSALLTAVSFLVVSVASKSSDASSCGVHGRP
jgi:thiamine transport system permease protein